MAGIGLRLHKLVTRGTYLEAATAYVSSAVIASGPWLTAVLALAALGGASTNVLRNADGMLLFATITYTFGASLILSGGLQMVITRYLADRLYVGDTATVSPTLSTVLLLVFPLTLLTLPWLALAPFPLSYRYTVASLFVVLALVWLVGTFLSAARDYLRVVVTFVVAYGISVAAALMLERSFGVAGGIAGFAFGQVVGLVLLVARIYREFPPAWGFDFSIVAAVRKYWVLFALGTLYMVAIWIDNVVYWFSPAGVVVQGFYHLLPQYDSAKLIAYITTIPASAVFLVHVETGFYEHYRAFFEAIDGKGTLTQIQTAREGMIEALRSGVFTLLMVQTCVVIVAFFALPNIGLLPGATGIWQSMAHWTLLAVSAQFMLFTLLLLLLYLDERVGALFVVLVFALGNAGATYLTTLRGSFAFGSGYLVAAVVASLMAGVLLWQRMRQLEYRTFMLQPIGD